MDSVVQQYERAPQHEWERLAKDAFHQLEFRATMGCLARHLAPESRILDAGGGPGRYCIELARLGHRLTMIDLAPGCVELAKQNIQREPPEVCQRIESLEAGDIRDLSRFDAGSFDAVLCLGGPLSHVFDAQDRARAMRELVRVTRDWGYVIVSVMGYLAALRTVLLRSPTDLADPRREALFASGDHVYTGGYCDTHFFRPQELKELAESAGLQTVEMRACEGLSSNLKEPTNALAAQGGMAWQRWLALLDETASDSGVIAASEHFIYAGRRISS